MRDEKLATKNKKLDKLPKIEIEDHKQVLGAHQEIIGNPV